MHNGGGFIQWIADSICAYLGLVDTVVGKHLYYPGDITLSFDLDGVTHKVTGYTDTGLFIETKE